MPHLNVEIKARCADSERVRATLARAGAVLRGTDRQTDTYFRCAAGRLKLREGDIENGLIHYARADAAGPKESRVTLYPTAPGTNLRELLAGALGVLVVVRKRRDIWFRANVKIHVDEVDGLGSFVEVEAIDLDGSIGAARLRAQCEETMRLLGVRADELVERSYSDLLLARATA
jgi:predicted adenylyl cyclase CyaB